MSFWDTVREMSAEPIRQEARRLFVLAIAGEAEAVAAARAKILGPQPSEELTKAVAPYLYTCSAPYSEQDQRWLRHADLIVSLKDGPGPTEFRPSDTLKVEKPDDLIAAVLAHRPELRVPLGRRFPGFRKAASEAVIRSVSRTNAEFAIVAGVSQVLPVLIPLFPVLAGADMIVLTKNQVFMLFRLAAIHGEEPHLKERVLETLPIIGGAFGWRTLARQAAGLIPGPWGLPVKAAIAFTGTYSVGRAAEVYFEQDRRPTKEEMQRILAEGKRLGTEFSARFRRSDATPSPKPPVIEEAPAALPSGTKVDDLEAGDLEAGDLEVSDLGDFAAGNSAEKENPPETGEA